MKNLIFLSIIVAIIFFATTVSAQSTETKIAEPTTNNSFVLGVRINPYVSWSSGEAVEGISLHIESGYTFKKMYWAIGYTPANKNLYSFNSYSITGLDSKIPFNIVGIIGQNLETGKTNWRIGPSFKLKDGLVSAHVLIAGDFAGKNPFWILSIALPVNLPPWKW